MLGRWPVARLLVVGTVALVVLRVALSLTRSGPVLFADESGYLGAARLLAGGESLHMGSSPFYRPGYSLLLVPLYALRLEPQTTYALALGLNALLAASLLPLLHLLLRRCFDLSPGQALGGAVVGATFPSVTTAAQTTTAENLLFPLLVLWLLACAALLRTAGRRAAVQGLLVGLTAGALWTVHGRMIVVLGLTAVVLVALAVSRRTTVAAAAAGLAAVVVTAGLARVLDARVVAANHDGRASSEISSTLARLDGLEAVGGLLRALAGSAWYVVVATAGVLVVVVVRDGRRTARALRRGEVQPRELTTALLLATLAGLLLVSAGWLLEPTRQDHLVYGRYVEPVLPPLIALGTAQLMGRAPARLRTALASLAVLTAVVAALRTRVEFPGEFASRWSGASLPFVTMELSPAVLVGAAVVAAGAAGALAWARSRRPGAVWLLVLALFLPITAFSQLRLVERADSDIYPAGWTDPATTSAALARDIGYDTAHFDRITIKVVQHHLPRARLRPFDGATSAAPTRIVLSGSDWPTEHPEQPATLVWRDPGRDQALWELGPAQR